MEVIEKITHKKCSKCQEVKLLTDFHNDRFKSLRVGSRCRSCTKEYNAKYNAKPENKARKKEYDAKPEVKARRKEHDTKPEVKARKREHSAKPEVKARKKEYNAKYKAKPENKAKKNTRNKERYNSEKNYKLTRILRARQLDALKGNSKSASSLELLGCSVDEALQHLENQFQPGMTWDNWTLDGWHVDHIKPCASFDMEDEDQQKECFHYSNLQPLWAKDNLEKGDKLNHELPDRG